MSEYEFLQFERDGNLAIITLDREPLNVLHNPMMAEINSLLDEVLGGDDLPAALNQVGMTLDQMDLIEVNEAFAIQVLANEAVLGWDRGKVNVHGGAIALGHPTGISGARIVVTLYHALKGNDKELGIASICGGGGVSMALIIKREF